MMGFLSYKNEGLKLKTKDYMVVVDTNPLLWEFFQ